MLEGTKLEGRCSICKQIKKELLENGSSKLQRRLYNCKKFNPAGETQSNICSEYGFGAISMSKHLKYHQNPDIEKVVEARFERGQSKYVTVQDKILDKGLNGIEDGSIRLTASTVAAVARDKMNQEEKNKDRQHDIMKLIFAFQAGELDEPTTRRIEGDIIEVED